MREIVIIGAARTAQGSFQGSLASVPAPQLGATAIRGALKRAGIDAADVDEVIMGNVLGAGMGQAPARQAAMGAGIPDTKHAMTINKVCGSGMMSIILGARSIQLGESDIVVAGGMENMSQAPYILPGARDGYRLGHQQVLDLMVHDGLWDPYNDQHMGLCAEECAKKHELSREDQDAYAIESFRRAQAAQEAGKFTPEIEPVEIKGRKGAVTVVDQDEGPGKANFEKMPQLRPVFDKEGTITPANASTINDGAAAVVLMSAESAEKHGCKPLARLVAWGLHSHEPIWFTTAPIQAVRNAVERAGWNLPDVDLFEINEAFAVVSMAAQKELEIPLDRLNVWGGAIALGHPIGASGARIVVTLLSQLANREQKRGIAGLCIGGGEGIAVCLER
jgi:acetyl-CoA C-acetyltransferase